MISWIKNNKMIPKKDNELYFKNGREKEQDKKYKEEDKILIDGMLRDIKIQHGVLILIFSIILLVMILFIIN